MPGARRPEGRASALENHLCDRLLHGMRQRQGGIFHSELRGELSRHAVEGDGGPASGHAGDLAIAPADAVIPARAQGLHGSFLGGEARGITFESIHLGIAVTHLAGGEDALQKTVSESLNGLADAGNFGDVDARAYDHSGNCPWLSFVSAVFNASSCSENTVRKSSSTRPSATRATMGGSQERRRAANSSALRSSQLNASRRVGRTEEGAAPPPITDSPSVISIFILDERACAASDSARWPISSFVSRIICNAGMAS